MPITYTDKVTNTVSPLPDINKVTAADMNEIKNVVNGKPDELGNYSVDINPYANGDTIQVFADKTKTQVENTADISTAPILGDVTGTLGASVVEKIQGIQVHTTDPTNGQVLQYVSANSRYEPVTLGGTRVDWSGSINPGGFASTSILIAQYVDNGVTVVLHWYILGVTATSNTTFTFTLPVAPNAAYTSGGLFQPIYALSNVTGSVGFIALSGSSTTATLYTSVAAAGWSGTAGHAKGSRGTVTYFK